MKPPITRQPTKFLRVAVIIFLACVPASPQEIISAKAGNIQWIKGEVLLNGTNIQIQDEQYIQMGNGQVLTSRKGYVEILLAPYAFLRLGENASLRMRQNQLDDIQLELNQGSALIEILKKLKTEPIRVLISDSIVEIKKEGLYRLDAKSGKLRVYGGDARAINGKKKARVKSGRTVALNAELKPDKFDVRDADALHRWAAQRSFTLFAKTLFFTKPLNPHQLAWKSRPEGTYNPNYRVTVAPNIDWNRYWLGVWSVFSRQVEKRAHQLRSDGKTLHTPSPAIPVPQEEQQ